MQLLWHCCVLCQLFAGVNYFDLISEDDSHKVLASVLTAENVHLVAEAIISVPRKVICTCVDVRTNMYTLVIDYFYVLWFLNADLQNIILTQSPFIY